MKYSALLGFSLIELLVVVSVIGILTGVGYIGFNSVSQDQMLKKAVKQLKSGLYEARQNAFYGKKPDANCTLEGYLVNPEADSRSVLITANCGDSNLQKEIKFDPGVTLEVNNPIPSFSFLPLNQGTDILATSMFEFSLIVGSKLAVVRVFQNGEIR
jgi:prepilin-type N-terminal cleavage/methylation domain-containing protein